MTRTSDLLTIRCPEDLLRVIDDRVRTEGKRKTDVVIQALRVGLGVEAVRQNGSSPANNGSGLYSNDCLEERFEKLEGRLESRFNEEVSHFVQQNKETVQQSVKQVREEVLGLFNSLAKQHLDTVQQSVQQSVQQKNATDNGYIAEDVKQLVPVVKRSVQQDEENVQPPVKQNVQQSKPQSTYQLEENVKQSQPIVQQPVQQPNITVQQPVQQPVQHPELVVQHPVQHPVQQSGEVGDDAAFVSDAVEDEKITAPFKLVKEPEETPKPHEIGLTDGATEREQLTAPSVMPKTTTAPLSGADSMISQSPALPTTISQAAGIKTPVQPFETEVKQDVQQDVQHRDSDTSKATPLVKRAVKQNVEHNNKRSRERPAAMSMNELAERLGVSRSKMDKELAKGAESFTDWTKTIDTDGTMWKDCKGQEGVKIANRFQPIINR